jgi:hypothetical protein
MTTIRVRTTARKIALKVPSGVRGKMARPATPGKIRRTRVRQMARVRRV